MLELSFSITGWTHTFASVVMLVFVLLIGSYVAASKLGQPKHGQIDSVSPS